MVRVPSPKSVSSGSERAGSCLVGVAEVVKRWSESVIELAPSKQLK